MKTVTRAYLYPWVGATVWNPLARALAVWCIKMSWGGTDRLPWDQFMTSRTSKQVPFVVLLEFLYQHWFIKVTLFSVDQWFNPGTVVNKGSSRFSGRNSLLLGSNQSPFSSWVQQPAFQISSCVLLFQRPAVILPWLVLLGLCWGKSLLDHDGGLVYGYHKGSVFFCRGIKEVVSFGFQWIRLAMPRPCNDS